MEWQTEMFAILYIVFSAFPVCIISRPRRKIDESVGWCYIKLTKYFLDV